MSNIYEGVVFVSDKPDAIRVFPAVKSRLHLRLVELAERVFGIYRVAGRNNAIDLRRIEDVAARVSVIVGRVTAFAYDDSCGIRVAVFFRDGIRGREFGDADSLWAPLDEQGYPLPDAPPLPPSELEPEVEYDCVWSAIDCGLEAAGVRSGIDPMILRDAFCYDRYPALADNRAG